MGQLALLEDEKKTCNPFKEFGTEGNWQDVFGDFLNGYAEKKFPKITTLSLFSGAGGLDIGFHDAGFDILATVELERAFVCSLQENTGKEKYFGETTEINCIDIRNYEPTFRSVDFIIGGPPCQTFSAAGARAMGVAGTKDERGNLFLEYVRLLKQLKPKGFLFENVYRIIGANQGRDWEKITTAFADVGYKLFYRILDTADYGVPQHRERLIIVGVRSDICKDRWFKFPRPTHGPDSITGLSHVSSSSALLDCIKEPLKLGLKGRYGKLLDEIPPGLNYSFFTEEMGHPNPIFAWRSKFSDFLYKADPQKPVRTIKAQGGQYTGPFHWDSRVFTLNELKRLQTFPDKYKIVGGRGAAIKQIGNSVPPQFARIMALSILEQIFNFIIPIKLDYLQPNEELGFRRRKREQTDDYRVAAAEALKANVINISTSEIKEGRLSFNIDSNFGFVIDKGGEHEIVSSVKKDIWQIDLHGKGAEKRPLFEITVLPKKIWSVPAKKIHLRSYTGGLRAYTAVWKALDYLLQSGNIKADLVQLCGYYQYEPAFKATLEIHKKNALSGRVLETILQLVCSENLTKANLHIGELASNLDFSKKEIKEAMMALKEVGYEVRSSGTNLSIEKETYLIPYAFPTLTPQSVQLNKAL